MRYCVELWSGDSTGLAAARNYGDVVVTVDIDPKFNPDICADILEVTVDDIHMALRERGWKGERIFYVWSSPCCKVFSVAGFHANHFKDGRPQTQKAKAMVRRHIHSLALIEGLNPIFWTVENPVGLLRTMKWMQRYHRDTITYCSYGDSRMKPTDLWGGFPEHWTARPKCVNNNPLCNHIRSPRGSHTGTQALDPRFRSHVPGDLSESLYQAALKSCHDGSCQRGTLLDEWVR
jgi:hypothetical protein|tara:strand:+ start:284 stop:985 length:702 start_codon:yes stop_codon:yes gene_type:complete